VSRTLFDGAELLGHEVAHSRFRMHGEDEVNVGLETAESSNALGDPLEACAPVLASVRCHDDDALVAVVELLERRVREADVDLRRRVDPGVAGDEDLADRDVLAHEILEVLGRRREVKPCDRRDHPAIQLLRKRRPIVASRPQPALDVHHGDLQMKRRERGGHRGRRVAVHEHRGGRPSRQDLLGLGRRVRVHLEPVRAEVLEAAHDRCDALVQLRAPRPDQRTTSDVIPASSKM
jgi:hypothetical protein